MKNANNLLIKLSEQNFKDTDLGTVSIVLCSQQSMG